MTAIKAATGVIAKRCLPQTATPARQDNDVQVGKIAKNRSLGIRPISEMKFRMVDY